MCERIFLRNNTDKRLINRPKGKNERSLVLPLGLSIYYSPAKAKFVDIHIFNKLADGDGGYFNLSYNFDFDRIMSRKLVIGELATKNARKFPAKEALVFGSKRYTWQEFDQRANRVANALLEMGVYKGDKVAVLFCNSTELIECYIGIAKVGAVAVPVNFRLAPGEIEYCVNNSEAKVLILDNRFLPAVAEVKAQLPLVIRFVVVGGGAYTDMEDYEELLTRYSSVRPEVMVEDEDDAFILYTSGTTGRPKGAVLTHKNLIVHAMISSFEGGLKAGDNLACVTPLFHIAAISAVIIHFYLAGKTIIFEKFDPPAVMESIDREKVNRIFLVPTMWQDILQLPNFNQYDSSSLRRAGTGAAVIPIQLKKQIIQMFPNSGVIENFGQTEMSPSTTVLKPEFAESKAGSVGQAFTMVEVRVVDDAGHDVPVGEIGEIVYRGPTMMKEYYKNPEATAEAFKHGWFHSGDFVRVDEEGFIYVVDRKKDMIISGGENIYPAEIESILYSHPKIYEVAVVGVPHEKWGEAPKAIVVLKPGESLTEQEVLEYCCQHLARYKRPQSVDFVSSLPRNAAGKVLKTELRKQYGSALRY